MLTQASKYAIRAVLFLADKSSIENKYGAKEIAEELEIPHHFIAKLLQDMARKKVISSAKGPGGGFYLSENNHKNNICKILDHTEKGEIFNECFLALPSCGDKNPCPVHHLVSPFRKALLENFETQTIKEFSNQIKEQGSFLTLKGFESKNKLD